MRRLRPLLGTYVAIDAADADIAAISAAFDAVALVHRLMSVQAPDSDISRINEEAWRAPVKVHPWTVNTLVWAKKFHAATGGLFDCSVGHELGRWGAVEGHGFDRAEAGSLADLQLAGDGTVRLSRRIALDLGGIAKGFAVDRAVATLWRHGVRRAVVNAGGDLRVLGEVPQPILLRDPSDGRRLYQAGWLADGAIATSTAAAGALVHVSDRSKVCSPKSFSVLAARCVIADALTKALAQTGRADAPWLARFGARGLVSGAAGPESR